jgi:hypothetical protein
VIDCSQFTLIERAALVNAAATSTFATHSPTWCFAALAQGTSSLRSASRSSLLIPLARRRVSSRKGRWALRR